MSRDGARWRRPEEAAPGNGITFQSACLASADGLESAEFDLHDRIVLQLCADVSKRFENAQIAVRVTNQDGVNIFTTCNTNAHRTYVPIDPGTASYTISFPQGLLAPGRYSLRITAHTPRSLVYDEIDNEMAFVIHDTGSLQQVLRDRRQGVVSPVVEWTAP